MIMLTIVLWGGTILVRLVLVSLTSGCSVKMLASLRALLRTRILFDAGRSWAVVTRISADPFVLPGFRTI